MSNKNLSSMEHPNVAKIRRILGFKPGEVAKHMYITPSMAKQLLEFNTNNRDLSSYSVNEWVRRMEKGDWKIAPDAVAFSTIGELSNGQHRLHAIIKVKKPQKFLVSLGIDNFDDMDRGKKRSVTDNISTDKTLPDDIRREEDIKRIANSIVRINKGKKSETSEVKNVLTKYGNELKELKKMGLFKGQAPFGNNAVYAAFFVAYINGVDTEQLLRVKNILDSGLVESEYDKPIIALRDKLMAIKGGGHGIEKSRYRLTLYCIELVERKSKAKKCTDTKEPKYTIDIM